MSYDARLREQVIIYNRSDGSTDVFGDPIDTFDVGTTSSAWVVARGSNEDIIDKDTRVSLFDIMLPASAEIYADSELEWNDMRMRVNGRPQEAYNHHGLHHYTVTAELIEG